MAAVVYEDQCVGCESCIEECPAEAICMKGDKATVLKEKCVDCGTCVDICPSAAIHLE
jgi:Na+-translocating ferredoxin:NAD+ oxidoreductase RNF subunit RnfB